ncbi:MAG: AsmA-like C-terminal region-containing protein, partial [Chthoniobacterales bacterium]
MALPASLLDPQRPRTRSGTFYRRWTWRRQVIASGTRLLVILSFALLLWGGWYLANRGLGRAFRVRVVEELRKRGIEASVRKLTLDPFRGLVARDVRIYDAKHREQPLLAISEVALDINYAALMHHQPFLNAIDVRDADASFPPPEGDPNASKAQLQQFRAHVFFPPDQIYISQAEGIFCGVRISATGQLLRPADSPPSTGLTEEELRARMQLLQRVAVELGRFHFAAGPPNLQIKFSGDARDLEKTHLELTLNGDRIQRGGYEIKTLALAGEWIDERLNVTQLEWTDAGGGFTARASWERLTSRGEYQARSSIALKPFLDAFGFGNFVADLTFASAPQIEISGTVDLANTTPRITALGRMQVEAFSYKNVALSNLSTEFSWDGERTFLRDVHVRHTSGEVLAEMLDAPGDFRLNVESSVNPVPIRTLFDADLEKFFGDWELPRSPAVRMTIRGPSRNPKTWTGDGNLAVQRARFRGVWANSATANLHLGDGALAFKDLHVARDEGTGTGGFTYDWTHHEVRIDNVRTHLRVADVIYWIQPKFFKVVTPYKFHAPPNLVANGIVQYRGGENTRLNISVDAPNGMDYVFLNKMLSFDRVKGNLLITDDRVQLTPVEGTLFGGVVRGNADIITKENDLHYSASVSLDGVDFPKLTDLYFKFQTAHGLLSGKYSWQANGDEARTMVGNGEMKVSNGDVFAIPVFGPLSGFLATIIPGAGYSIAKQA